MCLVFTQVASMVGLWVGLALIILFSEVILLDIFDHRASNGSADRDNETASPAPHTLGGRDRNRHLLAGNLADERLVSWRLADQHGIGTVSLHRQSSSVR